MHPTQTRHRSIFENSPILYIHADRASEWLPDISPPLAELLSENKRLWSRLSRIITTHYQLEVCPAVGAGIDYATAMLDHATLVKITEISGAIWHGRALARLIDKEALAGALSLMDERTYRLAVAHASLAPQAEAGSPIPVIPAKKAVLQDGKLCFVAWLNALPGFLSKRVELKFAPGWLACEPSPDHITYGPVIIRQSTEALLHE